MSSWIAFNWISTSSRFRNSSGYDFKICPHIFVILSQIGVVILVALKQEVERKSEWFCCLKFSYSNFKVE